MTDFDQKRQHLINEILQHGKVMKMWGFSLAMEAVHGIEKAETSTHATAQVYLKDRELFAEQERMRVEYAIDALIELGKTR